MARDIHDTLAQGFTGVVVQMEAAEEALLDKDSENVVRHVHRARELARESLAEARRSVHALRPQALESAIARIDADIVALKAGLEQTANIGTSQFNRTSDRLDHVEKAQTEPATKLAKLAEVVEKLRAAQAAVPAAPAVVGVVPAAAAALREVTGVTTPSGAAALPAPAASAAAPPKTEVARPPTVEGWVLRDVSHGGALIEGRKGLYQVYAGDPVPGLGRVDAIRKQDGRWVVVTTRGLVVSH